MIYKNDATMAIPIALLEYKSKQDSIFSKLQSPAPVRCLVVSSHSSGSSADRVESILYKLAPKFV